jgi:hypothetical protein
MTDLLSKVIRLKTDTASYVKALGEEAELDDDPGIVWIRKERLKIWERHLITIEEIERILVTP